MIPSVILYYDVDIVCIPVRIIDGMAGYFKRKDRFALFLLIQMCYNLHMYKRARFQNGVRGGGAEWKLYD